MFNRDFVGPALVSGIVVSTIAVLFLFLFLVSNPIFNELIYAQDEIPTTGFAPPNTTSEDQQDPPLESDFAWKGVVSSDAGILPGREGTQSAVVIPPREDGGMYTGTLTFLASRPVDVISWNVLNPINLTLSEDFGSRDNVLPVQGLDIALNVLKSSSESDSVTFAGNALELTSDEPFIVIYSLKARSNDAAQLNDVRNLIETAEENEEEED